MNLTGWVLTKVRAIVVVVVVVVVGGGKLGASSFGGLQSNHHVEPDKVKSGKAF